VIQYAESLYSEGAPSCRHTAYTPRAADTPRASTPPPREVYAEAIRRRLPSAYHTPTANV
jgi:hypothetical protein